MTPRFTLWPSSLTGKFGRRQGLALAACALAATGAAAAGMALAQDSDQQVRCMQLQQELASAQGGGSARSQLPAIDRQIADATRVFQGTKAAMEDAGCFQSFFIFGRGLVRSPKCLSMNDRVEASRRQVEQLQDQRDAVAGGGGDRRRQADLQDALARNGCGGQPQQARRDSGGGGGGLFNWFGGGGGGGQDEASTEPSAPVYRSIDPNGRYRAVCVRMCDGFFFPINYATSASHLAQDESTCQSNCAAPADLYVYRNPGQEIDQAISLNGAAYKDLPNAFRYRKQWVKGCSCKEVEYNPTEIEAAGEKADATPKGKAGAKGKTAAASPAPQANAAPAAAQQAPQQLDINVNDTTANAPASDSGAEAPAEPQSGQAEQAAPDSAPDASQAPAQDGQQSSVAKSAPAPQQ